MIRIFSKINVLLLLLIPVCFSWSECSTQPVVIIPNVYFLKNSLEYDDAMMIEELRNRDKSRFNHYESYQDVFDKLAAFLKPQQFILEVAGHQDKDEKRNLAKKRMKKVMDEMLSRGMGKHQLQPVNKRYHAPLHTPASIAAEQDASRRLWMEKQNCAVVFNIVKE